MKVKNNKIAGYFKGKICQALTYILTISFLLLYIID